MHVSFEELKLPDDWCAEGNTQAMPCHWGDVCSIRRLVVSGDMELVCGENMGFGAQRVELESQFCPGKMIIPSWASVSSSAKWV